MKRETVPIAKRMRNKKVEKANEKRPPPPVKRSNRFSRKYLVEMLIASSIIVRPK